eukprot:512741_1
MAQEVAHHAAVEKKFLCYAMQKLGDKNDKDQFEIKFGPLFTDILFEQVFEGLPGTLFGAKNKKIVTYKAPMLMYPAAKDVIIKLKIKKQIDVEEVKKLIADYIEKQKQGHTKDNLLFLLGAMHESKEAYSKACKCFDKSPLTEKKK